MPASTQALVVIDIQNDYFPGGAFPLWHAEAALRHAETAMVMAVERAVPVIVVQHVVPASPTAAPFFNAGTHGVAVHPRITMAAPDAAMVVKAHADGFLDTELAAILSARGVGEILLCGMMTHHCVTHTALSRSAEPYAVTVLGDCCASVDAMVHNLALRALADRVSVGNAMDVFRP
ncbi:MAG: cysteine hydrolase family protein [Desulfovibrionaceae bacterium]